MHIRSFIGAALLCLGMMAFAPVAMADPLPDICVLDLSDSVAIDFTADANGVTCAGLTVEVAADVPIVPDAEAAGLCSTKAHATTLDFAGHRQHEDPGRCLA